MANSKITAVLHISTPHMKFLLGRANKCHRAGKVSVKSNAQGKQGQQDHKQIFRNHFSPTIKPNSIDQYICVQVIHYPDYSQRDLTYFQSIYDKLDW